MRSSIMSACSAGLRERSLRDQKRFEGNHNKALSRRGFERHLLLNHFTALAHKDVTWMSSSTLSSPRTDGLLHTRVNALKW
jgi:hypothetical protein